MARKTEEIDVGGRKIRIRQWDARTALEHLEAAGAFMVSLGEVSKGEGTKAPAIGPSTLKMFDALAACSELRLAVEEESRTRYTWLRLDWAEEFAGDIGSAIQWAVQGVALNLSTFREQG